MKIQLVAGAILALAGALIFTGELAARSTSPATAATAAEIGDADNLDRGTVPLTSVRIAAGLSQPLYVTAPTGDFDRVFIVEKTGAIRIYRPSTGSVLPTPYLNIATRIISSGSEQGLLGLAFHPDFAVNGFFYVYFTAAPNSPAATTYIARYQAMGDPMTSNTADPSSEQIVLSQSQPFTNHNGGWVGFGKDGFLYAAFGDGGSAFDPGNNAQTITTNFLGKMLRIDVDGDDFPADPNRNYAVPASNPFVGVTGLDEIWAYGLRNHFRNSFDRETGDLWMGDVGQSSQEEIDFQPASSTGGENYGWRCMEGNLCTGRTGCTCMDPVLTDPIFTYARSGGQCAITGGYVYRGCAMPEMQGLYFFADYCSARIWTIRNSGGTAVDFTERTAELVPDIGTIGFITSFGEDAYGELYICDQGGEVFKIVADTPSGFSGPDCNNNNQADGCDILDGTSLDDNNNGIPDECDPTPCPWDLTGDGQVNSADLGNLLGAWANPYDASDLGALLGSWGPCPN